MNTRAARQKTRNAASPGRFAAGRASSRPAGRGQAARRLASLAVAAFTLALGAACTATTTSPHRGAAAGPRPTAATQRPDNGTPDSAPASAAPDRTPTPTPPPSHSAAAPGYTGPHFATPQAAMTYLAAAYNADDTTALHHVTEPRAFQRLMSMRGDALNLRLKYCTHNPRGDYTCYFRHDFPASEHKTGHGEAIFIAAPALNPGWYMYQFQSCD